MVNAGKEMKAEVGTRELLKGWQKWQESGKAYLRTEI
jgi:hypothetical protein